MVVKTDIEAILKSLTLEEKITLLAGKDFWETVPIPAKGVPNVKTTDGPNGARGGFFSGGVRAACFPAASCVAATFDPEAAYKIGEGLADECKTKGARCLLAPTTCIHRHPLGGRNFESFSEDPVLAGKLTAQVIHGCQSKGIAATIKHYAANEQETQRFTVDETVSERALREIYLRPFEIAIKESNPWAVMTAYNSVNGEHCDLNRFHLQQVLRGEWGWDGLVMSDWGGTNSTGASLNAGLDLEMPGPAKWREMSKVLDAVKSGEVSESTIDERARRVLLFLERLRCFEDPTIPDERAVIDPEHQKLIRETAAHGAVLLKNDKNVLPLSKDKVKGKKIAVLGLSKTALAHGGGSASLNAHYKIKPWDALQEALADSGAELLYSEGAHTMRVLPALPANDSANFGTVTGLDGKPGFTIKLYNKDTGAEVQTEHGKPTCSLFPIDNPPDMRIAECIGDFVPSQSGSHYMGCSGLDHTSVYINDELLFEQKDPCKDAMGFLFGALAEEEFTYPFEAGKSYRIRVRSLPSVEVPSLELLNGQTGLRLGMQFASAHDADLLGEAVELAKTADYALVFTGHDPQWETEGQDQYSFNLPRNGSQDALVAGVAAVNSQTVVINSTGVAVAMPWLSDVAGLIQSWFGGQECGNSIADVLTGKVCPEGRLPATFPKRLEDAPAYGNFPGEYRDGRLRVEYKEGVFVGYRHYDRIGRDKVNFPFGYGLSYTSFACGDLSATSKSGEDTYSLAVDVTNTGSVFGGYLVQIYAGRKQTIEGTPAKALVAFKKLRLAPGEKQTVELSVWARDCGSYDEKRGLWVVPAGEYEFLLGSSAMDIEQKVAFTVEKEITYAP